MTNTVNRNISYKLGRERFNFRVAGIVMNGDKILLHQAKQDDFWNLPGGKAELNESTEEAIRREMVEELGISAQVQRLAFICEDFYEYDDMHMHEIGFYYVISFPEAHSYYDEPEFNGLENDGELTFRWFPMGELEQMEIYPVFLRKELANLRDTSGIKHFIQK
ncbi:NUDIX hydrolase [Paenibacillus barcinonensis]|uniref:ADP-ribose pyrophosphatase YjhB (NUDIX family) n=1 Tax=Paenibacillus barcinonensis TaxID=198119 RepID=A0A2V4VNC8_PAEBA|nr:NUDIX hydrolase [Paenibacillus barcinonensis]PYE47804.1 ADP-ribose pyrophosphatase YjhB (NUDIX family) [Paenibacillus barcinonensis]QKS59092.1 NUDIX hydrolase [Paenibacillus barcinonensis]